jgi:hypothetical protein
MIYNKQLSIKAALYSRSLQERTHQYSIQAVLEIAIVDKEETVTYDVPLFDATLVILLDRAGEAPDAKGLHTHRPNQGQDPLRSDQAQFGESTRDSGG